MLAIARKSVLGIFLSITISVCCGAGSIASTSRIVGSLAHAKTATASSVSVDVRLYMAAAIASKNGTGSMLCNNVNTASCITSFHDGNQYGKPKLSIRLTTE